MPSRRALAAVVALVIGCAPLPEPGRGALEAPAGPLGPLTADEASKLLARLPALPSAEVDPFARAAASPPAPRPGATTKLPFPPPEELAPPPRPPARPLSVLRVTPEGDVELAPVLAVSFSAPMVPLTTVGALDAAAVPVKLEPRPKGAFRWLDPRTLEFVPEVRFPMATEYRVTIPAGTKAAGGEVLEKEVVATFRTPPPKVLSTHPTGDDVDLAPVVVLTFDQEVVGEELLGHLELRAGGRPKQLRLATKAELEADGNAKYVFDRAGPRRAVAVRAIERLPKASAIEVTLKAGAPSAEGPRRTAAPQRASFRTYGPFRVVRAGCYGDDGQCEPGEAWRVELTNSIDPESFDAKKLRIVPPLPELAAEDMGNELEITGRTKRGQTYAVTIPGTLRDAHGQTLGRDHRFTVKIRRAAPHLFVPGGPSIVLDPAGLPRLPIFTTNVPSVDVQVRAVKPADFRAWHEFLSRQGDDDEPPLPGRVVVQRTLRPNGRPDEAVETPLDLAPALDGGLGHAIVVVEPTGPKPRNRWERRRFVSWVQATKLGVDALADGEDLYALVTSLADGAPLAGVTVELDPGTAPAATGADGVAKLALPAGSADGPRLLVARSGRDVALLEGGSWTRGRAGTDVRWLVFDDRGAYRPGEPARVKGFVRELDLGKGGDTRRLAQPPEAIAWRLVDPRGTELAKGKAPLTPLGGFAVELELPKATNLGYAQLELSYPLAGNRKESHRHSLRLEEFRRPEFEVSASASPGPHFAGGKVELEAKASYYAGGALPGAPVRWAIRYDPGHFRPPGWDDFEFGPFVPWWGGRGHRSFHDVRDRGTPKGTPIEGLTDGDGVHRATVELPAPIERPLVLQAAATVTDVNRQTWTAQASTLVHPAKLYAGLRAEKAFVDPGRPIRVEAIAVDLEGKPQPGVAVEVTATRLVWSAGGKLDRVEPRSCTITSATAPAGCELPTAGGGGRHELVAKLTDADGRTTTTQLWVLEAGEKQPPSRTITEEPVTLVPDRKEYAPGDVAKVLVLAPFSPAEALVSVRRSGVLRTERRRIEGGSSTVEVPIEEGHVPNVIVAVELVGAAPRTRDDGTVDPKLPKRPAFAAGQLSLPVPPKGRALALAVKPEADEVEPGAKVPVALEVKDAKGRPVANAELTVAVVDESVLALTGHRWPDPLSYFHPGRGDGASTRRNRAEVVLPDPTAIPEPPPMAQAEAPGYANGGSRNGKGSPRKKAAMESKELMITGAAPPPPAPDGATPIKTRTGFSPLAAWAGAVRTGADGKATLPVELPDSLTRWRVLAVAAAGDASFGGGEATVTARLPLMVRPSPPRFLRYGDRLELPVVVQNQTAAPLVIEVAARGAGVALDGPPGFRVQVPARDRVEVRLPARVEHAGEAKLQVAAASGRHADAAQLSLPIYGPPTAEAFALYGAIEEGQGALAIPVTVPGDVQPGFGGLEVTTASTELAGLTDAVLYLARYPFECTEQLASRVLAIAALRDVLTAFGAEGLPPPDELVAAVQKDVAALASRQRWDGAMGLWGRDDRDFPWATVHAIHALARAKAKGFDVPDEALERGRRYLRELDAKIPKDVSKASRRTLLAYGLSVRARLGDRDPARARALVAEGGKELPLEAAGFVLPILAADPGSKADAAELRRRIGNAVSETAAAAHFVTSYEDGAHVLMHSDRRADGVLLEALLEVDPSDELLPKLVRGLLGHRKAGRWSTTQENAFVLLALDRWFAVKEKETPDFVARLWLGERFAGEARHAGRSAERKHLEVPMASLLGGARELTLAKAGKGRLTYRLGLRYAPTSLSLEALDRGFAVERTYEGVDDPADVRRDPDGTWHVKAGARVRVRVTMVAPGRRVHVALVDPLPAGLEAQNPTLRGTEGLAPADRFRPYAWPWFEHQNLRDDRAEAFRSLLWSGVFRYEYVARATTPGSFVVPPAHAEEMYAPETFGRSATARLVVDPPPR